MRQKCHPMQVLSRKPESSQDLFLKMEPYWQATELQTKKSDLRFRKLKIQLKKRFPEPIRQVEFRWHWRAPCLVLPDLLLVSFWCSWECIDKQFPENARD